MKEVIYRGYKIFRTDPPGRDEEIQIFGDDGRIEDVYQVRKTNYGPRDEFFALSIPAAKTIIDALIRADKAGFGPNDQDLVDIIVEDEFTNHTTEKKSKPKSKGFTVTRMVARLARDSERSFDARDIQRYIWKQKCVKVKITTIYAALHLCRNKGIIERVGRGTYRSSTCRHQSARSSHSKF